MGTINSAFSLISQGLDADQAALSVVANNVANANTPGYTEETPNWQENQPININGVSCGDGVTETGTTSVRDSVLDERLDQQQQLAVPVWRGAPRPPPESATRGRRILAERRRNQRGRCGGRQEHYHETLATWPAVEREIEDECARAFECRGSSSG